ncbi:hypothetical protein GCM10027048_30760 [Hymenobacter coalescens]
MCALTTQAQQGRKPAVSGGKAIDTAGKAAIPVGPILAGEEKLTAQERAERTFLMPARKKMPSVQHAAPRPQLDPGSAEAVAIGPPTQEEAAAEEAAAKAEASKPAVRAHRTSRRHHSARHRSSTSRRKSAAARRSTSSKKKSSSKKKTGRRR